MFLGEGVSIDAFWVMPGYDNLVAVLLLSHSSLAGTPNPEPPLPRYATEWGQEQALAFGV